MPDPSGQMRAADLRPEAGINAVVANQAAYFASSLKKLHYDRKLVSHAAARAQKAADYILNVQRAE
jgi:antirestriction protein ArdC